MSVQIQRVSHDLIYVNGKIVRQDSDGNWIANEELTTSESRMFYEHLNSEKLSMKNRLN